MNLFKRKETFEDLEQYEEDYESIDNIMEKEFNEEENAQIPQIIETYQVDYENELDDYPIEANFNDFNEDFDEIADNYQENNKQKSSISKIIMNILICIVLLLGILITIDVVMVSKFEKGPFFAINTKTYKDGGSKEYLGIGYKVIKYNQENGRKGIEIGGWSLTYSTIPKDIYDLDFVIEYVNNPEKLASIYNHKYVRVYSTVKEINLEKKELVLEYRDEDGKYTTSFICSMDESTSNITSFNKGENIIVTGTMRGFEINPNKIHINGCNAEKYIEISEE